MLKRLASRPLLSAALAGAVALIVGWLLLQDTFFRWAATPPGSFVREKAPAGPDYSGASGWAMRPAVRPAGAWERPWGVDVFFVHPTSGYAGDAWNTPIDDARVVRELEEHILPVHAAPFERAGPVYAPRYRQAALHAEINVGSQGDGAFDLAYQDVLRAFDAYMAADNQGRGVMLVGIGQGGVHALRLLRDRFQDEPIRQLLAGAYLIETAAPENMASIGIAQPLCAQPDSTHCVVAWRTKVGRDGAAFWSVEGEIERSGFQAQACVNPLLWQPTTALAPVTDHRGALRSGKQGPDAAEPRGALISARCVDGFLDVSFEGASASGYRPHGWGGRFKTPDYNLFFADTAFNASQRARAASVWLDENARKPAKPLPPAVMLPETPIFRPDGKAQPVR